MGPGLFVVASVFLRSPVASVLQSDRPPPAVWGYVPQGRVGAPGVCATGPGARGGPTAVRVQNNVAHAVGGGGHASVDRRHASVSA